MRDARADIERELQAIYPALARSARVLCRSSADADDVVQETIVRALESNGSFRRGSSLLTWAYAILTRVAWTANRKRRADHIPAGATEREDPLPPADAALGADESSRAVIDAIRALPQRQREMVTLHFLEDLTYAQIAEALGVSIGTVKATMFAAKSALREALATRVMQP